MFQYTYYSKKYRSLITAEETDFASCSDCLKSKPHTDNESDEEQECEGCNHEEARRITGKWTLTKILKRDRRARLYFKQGEEILCHVMFDNEKDFEKCVKDSEYELLGWQKVSSRHNTVILL